MLSKLRRNKKLVENFRKILFLLILNISLLSIKIALNYMSLEVIDFHSVIVAIISGTMFLIGIIYASVFSDFKESERIITELSVSFKNISREGRMIKRYDKNLHKNVKDGIKSIYNKLMNCLKKQNNFSKVFEEIEKLNENINMAKLEKIPNAFVVRLKNEISGLEKYIERIRVIVETSFAPIVFYLCAFLVTLSILILMMSNLNNIILEICCILAYSSICYGMLLVIRDMENPFGGAIKVSTKPIVEVEKYL
ncbi:MAG: hypothetical protein RMJ18_01465 [Candidatus Aenigmarchaeota archaeon]|nr:hypothetical protein [Candidatus Aenigmarchaeota archaeon]MCX8190821.1 hypothetical protein [Candidatus Aenigmarchaeota archaeon]MDW8160070.1 hypothetical protein [Candidatus Aenigmarchaeota archaeon]